MQNHIALFMVAAMAARKPLPSFNILRDVKWNGNKCNYHRTGLLDTSFPTTADHTESSSGDTATIAMTAAPGTKGAQYAWIGVQWDWKGYSSWQQVKDKPVTVSIDATHNVAAEGGDADTMVWVAFQGDQSYHNVHVVGNHATHAINERITTTYTTDVQTITSNGYVHGQIAVWMYGVIKGDAFTATQHVSGTVTIHSIAIHQPEHP